jgi:hypothetical protein
MSLMKPNSGENLSEFAYFSLLLPTFHYLFRDTKLGEWLW